MLQCDFQSIYASGIKGKAGLSPDDLAEDLGPLFEAIMRCIPGPCIDKDGALQMLVSGHSLYCFFQICSHALLLYCLAFDFDYLGTGWDVMA
jgi:predicted membrane GTPase involved in stress response